MTQIKAVAEVIESKMDVYGNIYNFVCVTNTLTGARALGHFSGNYSNIEHALKDLFGEWDFFMVTRKTLPIREYNQRVKGLPYIGCTPDDLIPNIMKQWGDSED